LAALYAKVWAEPFGRDSAEPDDIRFQIGLRRGCVGRARNRGLFPRFYSSKKYYLNDLIDFPGFRMLCIHYGRTHIY